MSRRKWSKEARQRARVRRAQKLLSVPVLAELLAGVDPPQQARESTRHPQKDAADSRGAQKSFKYMALRSNSVSDFDLLGTTGWEFIGLNNQGWHVFKREL